VTIAFFDLDRTLIARNSAAMWVREEFKQGRVTRGQMARALMFLLRYHLGGVNFQPALRKTIAILKGSAERELAERTLDFYAQKVRPLFRPKAREIVEQHRAQGDRLVLLTSSSPYLAEPASSELALHEVLCNRFEVDALGIFTGEPIEPLCFGDGKLLHATACAERAQTPLEQCYFYSDSMSDLPVFEAVGHPVAVNPDMRLRRYAKARGWQIQDWG
jgi:HAD superfamily hydrolase (TIGR01490 family)